MAARHPQEEAAPQPVKEIEPPLIKVTPETLDKALMVLRQVLEETTVCGPLKDGIEHAENHPG